MKLIIFDIDGTLIHSHKNEVDCFEQALYKVTGINQINRDLRSYQHVTDTGIAIECIQRHLQRNTSLEELNAIEEHYLSLFDLTLTQSPIEPIPGVHSLFENLINDENVGLAIATGSSYRSAKLKLHHAKLTLDCLPIASSNDSHERIHIMQAAVNKARRYFDQDVFQSITYVGDGPWDVQAVKSLNWEFIGIASGFTTAELQAFGAKNIVENYQCYETFLRCLNH